MATLLYIIPHKSSFISSDLFILKQRYIVKTYLFKSSPKWQIPFHFFSLTHFLFSNLFTSSVIISQFAGYHSFLPSLFSKISGKIHIIILHGTECNNFPEYRYGFKQKTLLFWFAEKSLRWATHLFPVSEALVRSSYTYFDAKYKEQGFTAFYPHVITPYSVIYNGVPDSWSTEPDGLRKPLSFLTVAKGINHPVRRSIKGLDLIIAVAKQHPECNFTFVGLEEEVQLSLPENISLKGYLSQEELKTLYLSHTYYLQLSISEGFGLAVVEAMMCGCIPIVSNVGIMPKMIGHYGYILHRKDPLALGNLLEELVHKPELVNIAQMRKHAVGLFAFSRRERMLLEKIEMVLSKR